MTSVARSGAPATAGRRRTGPNPVLLLPALLFFVVFALVPLVGAVALSLAHWDGVGAVSWAGLGNWRSVLADPVTGNALLLSLCLLYTSDAADDLLCVDLGGRRIIK